MLTRAATEGTLDRACYAAFESDYNHDENDADHQLPILRRDRGQIVRERRHHHCAEKRAEQRLPTPDRHPDDDLRREQHARQRRRDEIGMRPIQSSSKAGDGSRERKRGRLV